MIFNKLSEHDQTMIQDYIDAYGEVVNEEDVKWSRKAPLSKVLSYWEGAKEEALYSLLGNEFILRKEIVTERPRNELCNAMSDLICSGVWYNKLLSIDSRYLYRDPDEPWNPWSPGIYMRMAALVQLDCFVDNKYIGSEFKIFNPDNDTRKPVVISTGCKTMKAISKILNCVYGETFDFDEFRIKHSQILNQKELHGTLCLSIHPMDYMTMSDNASNWSSCMGWMPEDGDPEPGCYRRGTVEMMNSKYVIVAYLEGKDNLELPELAHPTMWNNKKWRTLAIVSPELITTVKSYPYQSSELSVAVVEWLRELARTNLNWLYEGTTVTEYKYTDDWRNPNCCFGDQHGRIKFLTGTMYNDFGTVPHYGIINANADGVEITYSGPSTCLLCGREHVCFGSNEKVYCDDCCETYCCACCENYYDRDSLTWFDGELICYDCYDDETEYDNILEERVWQSEMQKVYILHHADDIEKGVFDKSKCWDFYTAVEIGQNATDNPYDKYFTTDITFHPNGWAGCYAIPFENITEAGLDIIQVWGDYGYAAKSDLRENYEKGDSEDVE